MKLFHISDLHLGKRLNEFSLITDQEFILKQILTAVKEEKPDGLLVAGDVFDRSIPTEDAVRLWDRFLVRLAEMKVPVFAISGNHDSPIRFSDHGELVDATGIHLAPVYDGNAAKYRLESGGVAVSIYLLPFIKPAMVRNFFPDTEIGDYTDACRAAIGRMNVDPEEINILVAHQFVTGAVKGDSEEVTVGGLDNVDASVFDPFAYVALGHIHGKQTIGRETLRYCGTPLKYSFSEAGQEKTITVVNIEKDGTVTTGEIGLAPLHDLRTIRGTYEELTLKKNYENTQTDDYIFAVLTDEDDVVDAMAKLRVVYPNIMKIRYENRRTGEQRELSDIEDIELKTPLGLVEEFFEKQNNTEMSEEQRQFISSCIEAVWED